MPAGLSVEAVSAATLPFENYVPLDSSELAVPRSRLEREHGIPPEHALVRTLQDSVWDGPDVSSLALAGLGVPAVAQPLFLVRSGPLRDSMVAALAQLVHESGWAGEDLGITHLEELGGTAVFDLLEWAVPPRTGATVVVCDEPLFADVRVPGRFKAVGLRLRQGPGPLRVLGCGEGGSAAAGGSGGLGGSGVADGAEHRFSGRGPCDGWLAFHEALAAGKVRDGERVLIHARGPLREGWLLLDAVDVGSVLRADSTPYEGAGSR
ncbi:hypothetical protein [Catenulispora rubra]|uniref:hypothetical protein n=1 Tax=Catenulispora rubra TaxID=280293 RepID=UPI0018922501|nr:hypothetical protein [Catenulispora rubra]